MKLLSILTTEQFKELPDDLQENYQQTEGEESYRLFVDGLEEVSGLKSALKKERDNARTSYAQVKELEAQAEGETISADDHAALQKNYDGLTKTLKSLVKQQAIAEAIHEHRGTKALGPAYLTDKITVEVDGNEVKAFVTYGDDNLSVSDYVAELYTASGDKEHPLHDNELLRLFNNRVKSGSGTPPGNSTPLKGSKTGTTPTHRGTMSTKQKVDFIREHGEDNYMHLPA